jgi:hypothetical protein
MKALAASDHAWLISTHLLLELGQAWFATHASCPFGGLMISYGFLYLVIVALIGQSSDTRLYEILKDAQATNLASLTSGRMEVETVFENNSTPAARAESTVIWNGANCLSIFKVSDPAGIQFGADVRAAPLTEAPTEYALIYQKKLYIYNPDTNNLFIYDNQNDQRDRLPLLLQAQPNPYW